MVTRTLHTCIPEHYIYVEYLHAHPYQGRIRDFKLGGAYLKKIALSGGRREIFGVFSVKIHDFTPKKQITESPSYP